MKLRDSYHIYAWITIVFWSLAYILTRLTLQYFSALTLGFLRYFVAAITLLVIAVPMKLHPPARRDWPLILASGAVGFFLYMIAFNKGTALVTASTSSVVIATVPVFTALFARLFYGETLRRVQWVAIALEFAGILLLTLLDGVFTINAGILWLLAAAVFLSCYNLLQRKLTKTYSALVCTTYSIFAGTVMLAVFLPGTLREINGVPPIQWFYIAVLGVFSSAVGFVAWSKAFSKAEKTSSVSNYMFVTPFLATLFGFVIAGERPDLATVAGGAVILVGVFVFNFGGGKHVEQAVIRPLRRSELELCIPVIRESFGTVAVEFGLTPENAPTNPAFIRLEHLEEDWENGKELYGLFDGGVISGFVMLDRRDEKQYELQQLAVLPACRHKGYGKRLLDFAAAQARRQGGELITIGLIEENTRLRDWYTRYGFEHTGTKTFEHLPFTVGFMKLRLHSKK